MENSTEVFLKEFHRAKPSCTSKSFMLAKSTDDKSSYDAIVGEVAKEFSGTLLDLACGDGFLLEKLVGHGVEVNRLFGIDMSDGELTVAKSRPDLNGVDLIMGNARSLPYESDFFDVVTCHMALMLIPNVHEVLQEISRVLKSGGKFVAVLSGSGVPCNTMKFYV